MTILALKQNRVMRVPELFEFFKSVYGLHAKEMAEE